MYLDLPLSQGKRSRPDVSLGNRREPGNGW
jgi:hypothetical protein